jgi:hypothetical protein
MKKYFVTQFSIRDSFGTLNWRTQILDDYKIPEGYLERAREELPADVEFVTQHELYKVVKRRTEGKDTEIILSRAVGALLDEIRDDFPKAAVWIYEV